MEVLVQRTFLITLILDKHPIVWHYRSMNNIKQCKGCKVGYWSPMGVPYCAECLRKGQYEVKSIHS